MNKIKIGAIIYKLVEEKGLTNKDDCLKLDGDIRYNDCQIRLEKTLTSQARQVTIWHEVIHAILTQAGIADHNEQMVNALSYGIMDVLERNPELREVKNDCSL